MAISTIIIMISHDYFRYTMVFDGLPCKNYSLHLKSKFMFIQVFPILCFIFNRPNYWFSIRYKAYVGILPSMLHRAQKRKELSNKFGSMHE